MWGGCCETLRGNRRAQWYLDGKTIEHTTKRDRYGIAGQWPKTGRRLGGGIAEHRTKRLPWHGSKLNKKKKG